MSNTKLFAILGSLLLAIPLMLFLFLYVWFQTQFVQLGEWEDTVLVEKRWAVGETLNRCQFEVSQTQRLIASVHPRYIWERVPNAWPRGEGSSQVFKPDGTTYFAGGRVANTARVFVKEKDGGPVMDVLARNSLGLAIPDQICQQFK